MPSPFPGMDPYLEATYIWPDFHDRLAGHLSGELNSVLPPPYYARLEMRPEVGIAEEAGQGRRIVPDVALASRPGSGSASGQTAVLDAPGSNLSKSIEVTVRSEPLRHAMVEIRDAKYGHRLVTLIEIVSPSNKRPGIDRRMYLHKQREVLDSDASLVELDLLRHGQRLLSSLYVQETVQELEPAPDYLVLVNRVWKRVDDAMNYQIFPVLVTEVLPRIPVPLRSNEPEILLDLQAVFNRVYDTGPYRRGAIDYNLPPDPPLPGETAAWAAQRVRDWLGGGNPALSPPAG